MAKTPGLTLAWWSMVVLLDERGFMISQENMETSRMSRSVPSSLDRGGDSALAILAHELRQPLSAVLFGLEAARHLQERNEAAAQEMRDLAENQAKHMAQIIDELMDVCCQEHGTLRLRLAPVEVAKIIKNVRESVGSHLVANSHTLLVSLPSAPIVVLADCSRMEQVLVNLLINASKYTKPGGHIYLTVCPALDRVEIRVRDDGRGIGPALLPRIFDLYRRGPDETQSGLGLGLALVKSLVELHEGSVTASSKGLNLGSEFIVSLPMKSSPVLGA